MKVVVLGGAGDMGRAVVAAVAADPRIDSVLVADLDLERSGKVAANVGAKAEAVAVDVTDGPALKAMFAEVDIVLNAVGPFHIFGPPVLEAAIAAGVDYADLNDDWEPTLAMLDLHDRAALAGVTAIIGIGASPGITNLLAVVAATALNEVDVLLTGWRAGAGLPKAEVGGPPVTASAAVSHWVHNCADSIRVWRDHALIAADPLERHEVNYPGRGAGAVWTVGHPEPITLPRTFPGLRLCLNVMASRPGLIEAVRRVGGRYRAGELSLQEASDALLVEPGRRGPSAGEPAPFPEMFAVAEGLCNGVATRIGVSAIVAPDESMAAATAIPLAVCAGMLARAEISQHGVFAPEEAIDPTLFFERLSSFDSSYSGGPVLDVVEEIIQ